MTDTNKTTPTATAQTSASGQKVDNTGASDASRAGHAGEAAATTTAPKAKADKADGAGRGRVSQFSSMLLKATVKTNTRREGTHGHKSLGIILAAGDKGISYEDYISKGGRLNDLNWDINKDNVTAEKPKA